MVLTVAIVLSCVTTALMVLAMGPPVLVSAAKAARAAKDAVLGGSPTRATVRVLASIDPLGFGGIMDFWASNNIDSLRWEHASSVFMPSRGEVVMIPSASAGWVRVGVISGTYVLVRAVEDFHGQLLGWDVGAKLQEVVRLWLDHHRRCRQVEVQD